MIETIKKYMLPSGIFTGLFQLTFPLAIYLGVTSGAGWGWWLTAFVAYAFLYNMIGHNIGFHRCVMHGQLSVAKPIEWFFIWVGSMLMIGSPSSYTATHIIHHKYPDTELDPHGPVRGLKSIWMYWHKAIDLEETPIFSKRLVILFKKYNWIHVYYVPFTLISALILYLISYKVFLFLWFIPANMACWGIGWTVLIHHWGKQPLNSKQNTFTLIYEGLHLNHHIYPNAPNNAINPGEIDWTYQFSKIFFPKYNWRGQPNHNEPNKIITTK